MSGKIKFHEEIVHKAIESGELEIDEQGFIWRIAKRVPNRWTGISLIKRCARVRGEHKVPKGYPQVCVMFDKKRYYCSANRLVWFHHNGPIPQGFTINHKDGVKSNNVLSNLELATDSEQMLHAVRVLGTSGGAKQHGEKNHQAKLNATQVTEIRSRRSGGESLLSIAKDFGIAFQTVSKICLNSRWNSQ